MIEEWQLANGTRTAPSQKIAHLQASGGNSQQPAVHLQHFSVASMHRQWPSCGCYKCNVDAGFLVRKNITDIGICVRDDDSAFVLAKTISFDVVHSVDVGEALGLYHVLEWPSDM